MTKQAPRSLSLSHSLSLSLAEADGLWQAVASRDARLDGILYYGVTTTGVFCRPSCPSRRPKRENTRLFLSAESAEAEGFRACLRCRPTQNEADPALTPIVQAFQLLNREELPGSAEALAERSGLSAEAFRKLFVRKLGLSPKAVLEAIKAERLRAELKLDQPLAQSVFGAGYGSLSRVYERSSRILGMSPASYAKGGDGAEIAFAVRPSPFGLLLTARTAQGVCHVSLGEDEADLVDELSGDFPRADIRRDETALSEALDVLVSHLEGRPADLGLPLDIRATAFQWRVWQALVDIPAGETRTYGDLAAALGTPKGARAVGRACATNPVSILIPCHRAVGADGSLTGYRWGKDRKRRLLAAEQAGAEDTSS
ncbi:MAG: bifunctional transcriptional activator/DNA repair enzyme AdaA [Magnetovibrionaceae bacterium]